MGDVSCFSVPEPVPYADLRDAGLLEVGAGTYISPSARFIPRDWLGTLRPVVLGAGCIIGSNTVLYGGSRLGDGVRIEDNVTMGQPEFGYAVRRHYPGNGRPTTIGSGAVVRSGAVLYAGVRIGELTTIGHHALLRSNVHVGADCQLAHNITIERGARIGRNVRMSPQSHITADTHVGDYAFFGAGVRTVNSKRMIWRRFTRADDPGELVPPWFGDHVRIGSNSTVLSGVVIGDGAMVGAGSVVTRNVPPGVVAYGVPARIRRDSNADSWNEPEAVA